MSAGGIVARTKEIAIACSAAGHDHHRPRRYCNARGKRGLAGRGLRLVIGHMGEMLPVMLARIDEVSALDIEHLKRPISRTILDQVWLTTSGIFSEPPFLAALLTFGIDHIMFCLHLTFRRSLRAGRSKVISDRCVLNVPSCSECRTCRDEAIALVRAIDCVRGRGRYRLRVATHLGRRRGG